jgi:hypothetical protein
MLLSLKGSSTIDVSTPFFSRFCPFKLPTILMARQEPPSPSKAVTSFVDGPLNRSDVYYLDIISEVPKPLKN